MPVAFLLQLLALLIAAPSVSAETKSLSIGSRVLAKGRFNRKCSARIDSIPAPGYFRISFDRSSCGDTGQPYELNQLQLLTFVEEAKISGAAFKVGDDVLVQGFRARSCAGRVKELTRTGYASVDFTDLFCADTEALRKVGELTKFSFVPELNEFAVGQKISVPGITENEVCFGSIQQLTSNGFAAIKFEQLTCAFGGKLYSVEDLKKVVAPKMRPRQASGEQIFQRVMREIASKKSKHLSNANNISQLK